ncbi:hypothetical protein [Xanthomonas translucens]|nr:hypothetical protein [Xanthomonas translucens]AKK66058.1 hypothetical protein FD63_00385 [Xanthomonas translucens pv. undulosa]ELQ15901.1 hypothetical protein A989_02800 [Xanthomonas translucens DAR61454]MCT8270297.1 hypothetical protein [Xanthomonas translucens pv. undulosa]MCT8282410.1 hypothetical protein [Xanthomonas translucens pv. undulosa]MCT8317099.1 hypothetical protein [Xanthomonas translucens pv. undulosa]
MSERQWNSFGVDLMRRDFERRELYQRSGRPELTLNLPVRDIEDVHDATFQKRHINPDAWTPRQLLDAARRHGGDAEAEKVWSMMLDNSALGLNRATQTVDDVRKYDDAQLDAASYVGRMTGARIQASQTLPITDPDRIGAPNFSYMYDRQTHSWNTWVSNGEQTVVQPVRDPQQLRELDDTRALRLERQQLRQ